MATVKSIKTLRIPNFESMTIELSWDEAKTLHDITRKVGGPLEGRRRHIIAIERALNKAVQRHHDEPNYPPDLQKGNLYFNRAT